MSASYLLVLLTLNANGLPSAAFVHAGSAARCRQRKAMISGLLRGSGLRLLDSRCLESDLRFTPYRHDAPASEKRFVWRIDLSAEPPRLEPMPGRAACEAARRPGDGALCAVTDQRPLGWWGRLLLWFGLR